MQMLPITNMNDLIIAGELLARSGMFDCKTAATGFVIAATCHQRQIDWGEYLATYHLVEGKPTMRADSMAAKYRTRGGKYKLISHTEKLAKAEFSFEGNTQIFSFSFEDAINAGFPYKKGTQELKLNWRNHPAQMLWARLISSTIRILCPEINAGYYTPEELQDVYRRTKTNENVELPKIPYIKPLAPELVSETETEAEKIPLEPETNFEICPIGGPELKGKKWEELTNPILDYALATEGTEISGLHKARIRQTLAGRKAASSR